jgi:hypothetical protein
MGGTEGQMEGLSSLRGKPDPNLQPYRLKGSKRLIDFLYRRLTPQWASTPPAESNRDAASRQR